MALTDRYHTFLSADDFEKKSALNNPKITVNTTTSKVFDLHVYITGVSPESQVTLRFALRPKGELVTSAPNNPQMTLSMSSVCLETIRKDYICAEIVLTLPSSGNNNPLRDLFRSGETNTTPIGFMYHGTMDTLPPTLGPLMGECSCLVSILRMAACPVSLSQTLCHCVTNERTLNLVNYTVSTVIPGTVIFH